MTFICLDKKSVRKTQPECGTCDNVVPFQDVRGEGFCHDVGHWVFLDPDKVLLEPRQGCHGGAPSPAPTLRPSTSCWWHLLGHLVINASLLITSFKTWTQLHLPRRRHFTSSPVRFNCQLLHRSQGNLHTTDSVSAL